MFKEFFLKELGFAFKRPMIYIFVFIISLLVFGAVVSDNVIIGGAVGNIYKNAPSVVTMYTTILTVIGLLFATTYFNNAALRDHNHGFHEIMFSTPISKSGYFFGKFAAAWIASSFVFCGIFVAFILGTFIGPAMGWIGPERVGPIPWKAFINNYFLFIVPNMFLAGAIIYGLATKFKSTIISFVGTLAIIIGYIVSLNMLGDLDSEGTAAMADMFGVAAHGLDTKYYTPQESNTIAPSFTGYVRINRIIWSVVGLAILMLSYFLFSFKTKAKKVKKQKTAKSVAATSFSKPSIAQGQAASGWNSFVSFFKINFLSILKSTLFKIMVLFGIIMLVSNIFNGFEYFGLKSYPVTYKLMDEIRGIAGLFIYIVLVFYSGELIWRDRDNHISEVIDGTPHSSTISLFAKTLSLISLACLLHVILIVIAIIYQALNGYTKFELGVYFTDFFYQGFLHYTVIAGILIFIQVLVNNKYLGYFVSILFIFFIGLMLEIMKIDTGMLRLAHVPSLTYSDMNKFGPGIKSANWFSLYWVLFSVVLLFLAGLIWARGKNIAIKDRWSQGLKSVGKSYVGLTAIVSIAWVACAGFVYYNTQMLNPYLSKKEDEQLRVDYENKFKQYQDYTLPKITDIVYDIDIYPEERNLIVKADMTLVNKSDENISQIIYTEDRDFENEILIPGATRSLFDEKSGFQIYDLATVMAPGDTIAVVLKSALITKGFENDRGETFIVRNGTFLNNTDCTPALGYVEGAEISDKNKRRKYDLPERKRMPELQSNCSELCMNNYLSDGTSDWVNVETYISTTDSQIAVAPGSLISMNEKDGRREYHYKVDHPSLNFYSFISAEYEVATRKWQDVDLEVYYHKGHEVNIERMLDAMQKSLEYYTTHFGPYYHKQARIIEFPRYSNFAQAFPGTMPYSESFGFIINLEGEDKNNVIDAVIAHELAHQYWAHQVIGASMQGSTMLSESFAEYSSLMVMKQTTSEAQMKDFLRYDMRRYLRGRSSEVDKELPLNKVENQMHIHYGKGSIIMYALQDYVGEEKLNKAMRGFLEAYRYQEPPYPTSNDFLRFLEPEVPDSLQYLIADWIKDITLYDLRMNEASYMTTTAGKYQVNVSLENYKIKADSMGNETKVPINDWVDVGFYKDSDEEDLIYKERIFIDRDKVDLSFVLDTIPAKAAVDPNRLLIERVAKDNVKVVESSE